MLTCHAETDDSRSQLRSVFSVPALPVSFLPESSQNAEVRVSGITPALRSDEDEALGMKVIGLRSHRQ